MEKLRLPQGAATLYVYRFEDERLIERPPLEPELLWKHIRDAARGANAKLQINRVDRGFRTMKVRMSSSNIEFQFRLRCLELPPG